MHIYYIIHVHAINAYGTYIHTLNILGDYLLQALEDPQVPDFNHAHLETPGPVRTYGRHVHTQDVGQFVARAEADIRAP
jgi:hypothetical protein